MDVKDFLREHIFISSGDAEISGWLVDSDDGLFILGEHFPEDLNYRYRLKISNQNIMYQILRAVPSLGGGHSLLFYRAKAFGKLRREPLELYVDDIFIQEGRTSSEFVEVKFDEELVNRFVRDFGDYNFRRNKAPMRDWLED